MVLTELVCRLSLASSLGSFALAASSLFVKYEESVPADMVPHCCCCLMCHASSLMSHVTRHLPPTIHSWTGKNLDVPPLFYLKNFSGTVQVLKWSFKYMPNYFELPAPITHHPSPRTLSYNTTFFITSSPHQLPQPRLQSQLLGNFAGNL